uniref:Uncharacterized protein n=1 Tax=Candidatus Kentrum sp. DK TaxID=2126562 RepID=A0A450RX57_9GAMM|nr:MAG: hypothetical protein BECKDK2373B_GA0170837_100629 [Candidatus Kentron sp. DK]
MIFVSIAEDKSEFAALKYGVDFRAADQSKVGNKPANLQHKELLIPPEIAEKPKELPAAFADIAAEFSRWLKEDEVTVLVSRVRPMDLNPLLKKNRESLLAMLILAFPEARWFFGTILGYDEPNADTEALDGFRVRHGLFNLFQPQQTPFFDGAGLRDWVRRRAKEDSETKKDAGYLPRREQLAIAMDEETYYAHLYAYTAYRFGFRSLAISARTAADAVLGPNASPVWRAPYVSLEDLYLNFPDGGGGLSDLGDRRKEFPALGKIQHRILMTSNHGTAGNLAKNARNRKYIAENGIRLLHKPHAGMLVVWEASGLGRRLRWGEGKVRRGVGEGYVWPPDWREIERIERKEKQDGDENKSGGHSSPGILLLIARCLIDRAKSMLPEGPSSVEEAVRGAVLVGDALELLGGKTPTAAAEALSLRHQFELYAEYGFIGVEKYIPLDARFQEIERDAKSIALWFGKQSERTALNIQINTVNQLVRILRAHNQFDEEQVCTNRARHLHNSLYMHRQPWRYVFLPLLRYSEFLFKSFSRFALAIFLWIGGLSGLFAWALHAYGGAPGKTQNIDALPFGNAIGTFFGTAPVTSYGHWAIALSVFAIVAGLAHLGIFISYLYTLVSRR